jgi:hypothetical protein
VGWLASCRPNRARRRTDLAELTTGWETAQPRRCECGAADCNAVIYMTWEEQDRTDHVPKRWAIAPGHTPRPADAAAQAPRRRGGRVKGTAAAADFCGAPMWTVLAAVLLFPSSSVALGILLTPALGGEGIVAGLIATVAASAATAALCFARKRSWPRLAGLTAVTATLSLVALVVRFYVGLAICGAGCVS